MRKYEDEPVVGPRPERARRGDRGTRDPLPEVRADRPSGLDAAAVLQLQAVAGNRATTRLLAGSAQLPGVLVQPQAPEGGQDQADEEKPLVVEEEFELLQYAEAVDSDLAVEAVSDEESGARQPATIPAVGFVDGGRTSTVPYGGPTGQALAKYPHLFTAGGRTGTVPFAGGGGAGPHGNEPAGSVQRQVLPVFESVSHGILKDSEAWVRAGTGELDVTRSFVGSNAGDQGNGWYVTPAAAARGDAHEGLHVTSSQGYYTALIDPLLRRATERRTAYTQRGAISDLRAYVNWPDTVTAFQTADEADNKPMGAVDVADLKSPTFPVDAGPGTVGGKAYQHRVRLPAEPNPT